LCWIGRGEKERKYLYRKTYEWNQGRYVDEKRGSRKIRTRRKEKKKEKEKEKDDMVRGISVFRYGLSKTKTEKVKRSKEGR